MAQGLFATLLVGTILEQVGTLIGGSIGAYIIVVATVAKKLTGAGIGIGVASKFKEPPLVTVSAAAAGMIALMPKPSSEAPSSRKGCSPWQVWGNLWEPL